jgi:hypothetical protein
MRCFALWLGVSACCFVFAGCDPHSPGGATPDAAAPPDAGPDAAPGDAAGGAGPPDARSDDAVFFIVTVGDGGAVSLGNASTSGVEVDGGVRYGLFGATLPPESNLCFVDFVAQDGGGPDIGCGPSLRPDLRVTTIVGGLNLSLDLAAGPCGLTLTEAPRAPDRRGYLAGSFAFTMRDHTTARVPVRGVFRVPTPFWWARH